MLVFNCTVVGGVATVWDGSAFDCSSTNNEIILRHSQFSNPGGISGDCSSEAIRGRSLDVQSTSFTSQLSVTVSSQLNGQTVQCSGDAAMTTVGTYTITSGILIAYSRIGKM